jgi:hypothetical protein
MVFSLPMAKPDLTYIDEEGNRYHSVAAGTRLIGKELITERTLWAYAKAGRHPCGLDLGVIKHPLLRTSPSKPRTDKEFRFLLREDRLELLRDLLQEYRTHRRGPMTDSDFAGMREEAARRVRRSRSASAISL